MDPSRRPEVDKKAMVCPHCSAFSEQVWYTPGGAGRGAFSGQNRNFGEFLISVCRACDQIAIWKVPELVWPAGVRTAPTPNPDLPPDVASDYEEAAAIVGTSPRGSAALLRLAVQKLMVALGMPGKNLNDDVGELVKRGLNPLVQKALDGVRVIGNEAVHPGQLDLRDDAATTTTLFFLVNLIAEQMITIPRAVQGIYDLLPAEKREAIEKRDGGS